MRKMEKNEANQKGKGTASASWYGAEPDIPASAIAETINTEILICGAGSGGMMAALAAAKGGAKTLVIEKNATVGILKTYIGAVDTRAQKAFGNKTKIDKEKIVQELIHYGTKYTDEKNIYGPNVKRTKYQGANPVNEQLIRLWVNESGAAVDFMADELAEFGITHVAESDTGSGHQGVFEAYPVHTKFTAPILKGGPLARTHGSFFVAERYLVKKAKSYGAEFRFNTPLVKLFKVGNRVAGAIAKRKDGRYICINASKGVLLCTGGYEDDQKLYERLNPEGASVTTFSYVQSGTVGDGIKAGIWAGAEKDEYPSSMLFDRGITKPGGKAGVPFINGNGPGAFHFGSQPFLKVNMDGKRYCNESVTYDAILWPLQDERNGVFCQIWDANYWRSIEAFHTLGCSRHVPSTTTPRTYEGFGKFQLFGLLAMQILQGHVKVANTIEGLAKKLKLPPKQLEMTVEQYNKFAKSGVDTDFGKPADHLFPLNKPPYYGATVGGWLLCTMDGLKINGDMQVVDSKGEVIEGLYAAGNVAGGFFANNFYPELIIGVAVGKTVTFARHAVLHMRGAI